MVSASISEAAGDFTGTNWGVMLRYAGDWAGFRVAAGIGYEHIGDVPTPALVVAPPGGAYAPGVDEPDINAWGGGLSIMHVASGLFLQGSYQVRGLQHADSTASQYWGDNFVGKRDADGGRVHGGIPRTGLASAGRSLRRVRTAERRGAGIAAVGGRDFSASNGFAALNDVSRRDNGVWASASCRTSMQLRPSSISATATSRWTSIRRGLRRRHGL